MTGQVKLWLDGGGAWLKVGQRATHTYVIGQPGTGKSRALESWFIQDVLNGHGVGVIDPAGDLYQHLLFKLSLLSLKRPDIAERVVLIDPSYPVWTVGFNPLEPVWGISTQKLVWLLTDVIIKIWKVDVTAAPRMTRLLTFTFLVLAEMGLTLVDLPRFLTDSEWREVLLARSRCLEAIQYFRFEFPSTDGGIHQWVTPVLNKIGPLIFDPDVALMFSEKSTINFRQILDKNSILLVNLSKGVMGEGNSALLGAFIMAHIQQAALSRANSNHRAPFFLYLDEFQNYTTDNIKDILAESRKYGLSLTLAHQYLDQLSADLRSAVLSTTGTIACFRVGYSDASVLAKEIFPAGFLKRRERDWSRVARMARWLGPFIEDQEGELPKEDAPSLLCDQEGRQFWMKTRGPAYPVKMRTMETPEPKLTQELWDARNQLLYIVGQRYGRLKRRVKQENHGQPINANASTTYYEKI